MAETTYSYVAADFADTKLNPTTLAAEIRASAIVTALDRIDTAGGTLSQGVVISPTGVDVVFKDALSAGDKTVLDADTAGPAGGLLAAHDSSANTGTVTPNLDLHGNTKTSQAIQVGGGFRHITHDYCDATTWWQASTEHLAQASATGDDLTHTLTGHTNLIDVRHGKLTFEDDITAATVAPNSNTMTSIIPQVYEDAVLIADTNEVASPSSGDEYSIDYAAGTVTFGVARSGSTAITVDFRKAGSSVWCLKPTEGNRLILEDAEIDVSEDIDMTTAIVSTVFGSHTTLTGGTIVPIQVRIYKTFHDFQAAARKFWGPVPANFGGTAGVASPKWTFQWEYSRSDELYYTANYVDLNLDATKITVNRIEVSTVGDGELGGSVLTMAFYGQDAAETNGG